MLKSTVPVIVSLCAGLLSIAVPASAYDGPFASAAAGSARKMMFPRQMQKFTDNYIKINDVELAEIRDRSYRPFMIIDSVMDHYDLPPDLRYLAVIESELRPGAVSRVGAKGPWQLMAGTARDLGLKVNYRLDERTNFYKSTTAAALYLRDLHREFKDWLLVLAAYNAGPAPVNRAIRLAGSRNFWALERYLPAETRQHVRRFIATAYYFNLGGPGDEQDLADGARKATQIGLFSAAVSVNFSGSLNVAGTAGRDGGQTGVYGSYAVGIPGRPIGVGLHEDGAGAPAM